MNNIDTTSLVIKQLRDYEKVLKFYANSDNYEYDEEKNYEDENDYFIGENEIMCGDTGDKARRILEKYNVELD